MNEYIHLQIFMLYTLEFMCFTVPIFYKELNFCKGRYAEVFGGKIFGHQQITLKGTKTQINLRMEKCTNGKTGDEIRTINVNSKI